MYRQGEVTLGLVTFEHLGRDSQLVHNGHEIVSVLVDIGGNCRGHPAGEKGLLSANPTCDRPVARFAGLAVVNGFI